LRQNKALKRPVFPRWELERGKGGQGIGEAAHGLLLSEAPIRDRRTRFFSTKKRRSLNDLMPLALGDRLPNEFLSPHPQAVLR